MHARCQASVGMDTMLAPKLLFVSFDQDSARPAFGSEEDRAVPRDVALRAACLSRSRFWYSWYSSLVRTTTNSARLSPSWPVRRGGENLVCLNGPVLALVV